VLVLACSVASASQDAGRDEEPGDRIGLADQAAYRAALSGKPTADDARPSDPPKPVGFRDLWEHPEAHRGRRITIRGRLERTFRQGAVGSFPPLVEAWVFSAAGDPFCVVYPRPDESSGESPPAGGSDKGKAGPGRPVRFTGTFLKTVRYPAGDGERLAPLIVGDRPPVPQPAAEADGGPDAPTSGAGGIFRAIGGGDGRSGAGRGSWTIETVAMGLILAAIAALMIVWQHLRAARVDERAVSRRRRRDVATPDPPLHFIDSPADDARLRYGPEEKEGRIREEEPLGELGPEGEPRSEADGAPGSRADGNERSGHAAAR
jgi:hypothetical protein